MCGPQPFPASAYLFLHYTPPPGAPFITLICTTAHACPVGTFTGLCPTHTKGISPLSLPDTQFRLL